MVLANIVQKNITTLILILPNGLCLVILYTMKHEIQSMYRTILIYFDDFYNSTQFSSGFLTRGIYSKISAIYSRIYSVTFSWQRYIYIIESNYAGVIETFGLIHTRVRDLMQ